MRRRLIFLALLPLARPHGVLTIPAPRPLPTPQGVKLEPFSSARDAATRGCGLREGIPGTVVQPTQAFTVGRTVQVQWDLTIPHPADVQDTGIRIAIHYDDQDSFGCNILAGGLDGDPNFDPYTKATHLSAGPVDAPANTLVSTIVTLPNKTCDYCVLQWVWAARVRVHSEPPRLGTSLSVRTRGMHARPTHPLAHALARLRVSWTDGWTQWRILHQLRRHRHHGKWTSRSHSVPVAPVRGGQRVAHQPA